MNPFETETMAELCFRQGHSEEAAGIYRRLLDRATDERARERLRARLGSIAGDGPATAGEARLAAPGLRTSSGTDQLTVDWRLPPGASKLVLQLLLVLRNANGIVTESRTLPLETVAGRLVLKVPGLHSARAAAGFQKDGHFVPLLRS